MKILIVSLGKSFGGAERHILDVVEYINKNQYNIELCVRKDSLMHRHISSELSIPVFAFDFNDIYKSVYLLKQLILEKRYDVVHSHGIN